MIDPKRKDDPMSDRYTIRDGMVYGISRDPKKGTEVQGLLALFQHDPHALTDIMNLCHCEGRQAGMKQARKIVFGTDDGELAIAGAVANIIAGGGGPINAAQRAEVEALEIDDEDRDAADAAEIAREQEAQVRRTTAATKARVGP